MPDGLSEFTPTSPEDAATRFLNGLPEGTAVAVALSGGGDSVGLLAALHEAQSLRDRKLRLAAITVDHGLRSESAAEAAAMEAFCRSLSIPHLVMTWQGEKPTAGLSAAARAARYRLLAEGVRRLGSDCLVTAHTLDDQLETVEMRRRRSASSLRGLAGIAPSALFFGALPVHRPFLSVLRADIRSFLKARGIGWIDDPSNDNTRFERVRVRQAGEFAIGAHNILEAGRRRTRMAQAAADYLRAHAGMPLPMLFALEQAEADEDVFSLALATLVAVAGGQMHLPGQETFARLHAALSTGATGKAISLGRSVVERRRDVIYIGRELRNLPTVHAAPGEDVVWDGRFLVRNRSRSVVKVAPAAATSGGLPPAIARRASATLPDRAAWEGSGVACSAAPYLAPFETVLSCFDAALADTLCTLTAREHFPSFTEGGLET